MFTASSDVSLPLSTSRNKSWISSASELQFHSSLFVISFSFVITSYIILLIVSSQYIIINFIVAPSCMQPVARCTKRVSSQCDIVSQALPYFCHNSRQTCAPAARLWYRVTYKIQCCKNVTARCAASALRGIGRARFVYHALRLRPYPLRCVWPPGYRMGLLLFNQC